MKHHTMEVMFETEVKADVNEGGIYKQRIQFSLLKKRKMDEIQKNKNGKCLRIRPFTPPDVGEAIKRPSAY